MTGVTARSVTKWGRTPDGRSAEAFGTVWQQRRAQLMEASRLIAIIGVLDRESRDNHYASGALRIAHNHLDALIAIRRGLGGV